MLKRLLLPSLLVALMISTGCSAFSPAESRSPDDLDATVEARVEATISGVGYIEPVPPTPTALSNVAIAEETAEAALPEISFEERRIQVVEYLRSINAASDDYLEARESAAVEEGLLSDDIFEINSAVNTSVQITEGAHARIGDLVAPVDVPELSELQDSFLKLFGTVLEWQTDYREAVLSGDLDLTYKLELEYPTDYLLDEVDRIENLQHDVLARFNIPDSEVGYVRSLAPASSNDTERQTVQAAMDLFMADKGYSHVTASELPANDLAGTGLYPDYLRRNPTKCFYTWDTRGTVTQHFC